MAGPLSGATEVKSAAPMNDALLTTGQVEAAAQARKAVSACASGEAALERPATSAACDRPAKLSVTVRVAAPAAGAYVGAALPSGSAVTDALAVLAAVLLALRDAPGDRLAVAAKEA